MSILINTRISLETALDTMATTIPTAYENAAFAPPASSAPYQVCNILFAQPDNLEYGSRHIEQGFMQIKLMYPLQKGTFDIATRAELLRSTFARGNTFTHGGTTVTIGRTPEIMPGRTENNMFLIVVKIRFFAS